MTKVRIPFYFLVLALLMLVPVLAYGQHEMVIPGATGPGDYLNDHVAGDTTATGDRVDPDRVYVLQRGGIYFVNNAIHNRGYNIRMKAEDGSGTRPVIYIITNAVSGTLPGEIFRVDGEGGNVWLKDLMMVGILEADTTQIHNIPTGFIRVDVSGFDIVIDNCMMNQTRGQNIRTEGACRVIKITNSVLANMGDLERSNLGAGKALDIRGTSCDSLIFINNTFVNFQDRIIRHRSSTGALNNLVFDHNTLVNGFSYHGTLALGWMGTSATITNNLFMDTFIAGNDTDATRQSEFNESGELDPYGFGRMTWIFSQPDSNTNVNWKISNNYYSVSSEVQAFYDRHSTAGMTGEGSPLTYHINSKLGADSATAFTKTDITLANGVSPMVNLGDWYRAPDWGANKTKATGNFVRSRDDFDRRTWQFFDQTFDGSYGTTVGAYTGALGGYPVGDLNWYPDKKADWEQWVTAIDDRTDIMPAQFALYQNYPNPFNPATKIAFNLVKAGKTSLSVYNVLGQKIATLLDKKMSAGTHEIEFNARNLSSGIYFYRLESDGLVSMKKMVLLK